MIGLGLVIDSEISPITLPSALLSSSYSLRFGICFFHGYSSTASKAQNQPRQVGRSRVTHHPYTTHYIQKITIGHFLKLISCSETLCRVWTDNVLANSISIQQYYISRYNVQFHFSCGAKMSPQQKVLCV